MPRSNHSRSSLSDDDEDFGHDHLRVDDEGLLLPPRDIHIQHARWIASPPSNPVTPKQRTPAPASLLPPEILIHTLRHLAAPKDLHSALLVCRAWCECTVELLWHKPSILRIPSLFRLIQIIGKDPQTTTFNYAMFVKRLNFVNVNQEITDTLFGRISVCVRLERLTLVNCSTLTDESLGRVLACTPSLVALDLTGVTETTDEPIVILANTAKGLQGINLGGCKKITDASINALAESCPQMRRIKLSGLELITDDSILKLVRNCPQLIEIDLHCCISITSKSVQELWRTCRGLREMRLSGCVEVGDEAFPVAPLPNANSPSPFPTPVLVIPEGIAPLHLTHSYDHLRMLDLTSCTRVTDTALEGIVRAAPKIRNLVLAKVGEITDRGVQSICVLGKHLHYLHLGHATSITDRGIRLLVGSCTRLRYIDFACCHHLTDLAVHELAGLPKLRRIGLVRVINITDHGVIALVARANTMERIHLSYCDNISLSAIHILLTSLVRLTHLSLTGIQSFRKDELQKFCRPPPREFNAQQRQAFCVYSGSGIVQLRRYLDQVIEAGTGPLPPVIRPGDRNDPVGQHLGMGNGNGIFNGDALDEDIDDDDNGFEEGEGERSDDEETLVPGQRHGRRGRTTRRRNEREGRDDTDATPPPQAVEVVIHSGNGSTLPVPSYDEVVYPTVAAEPSGSRPRGRPGGRERLSRTLRDAGALIFGRSNGSGAGSSTSGTTGSRTPGR